MSQTRSHLVLLLVYPDYQSRFYFNVRPTILMRIVASSGLCSSDDYCDGTLLLVVGIHELGR